MKYTVRITNTNQGGESNPALLSFAFDAAAPSKRISAQILRYLWGLDVWAAGTSFDAITESPLGGGPGITLAWPDEYSDYIGVGAGADFPAAKGSATSLPPGTGIRVNEYTAQAGRSYRGWHTLPFVASSMSSGGGKPLPTVLQNIAEWYESIFLDPDGTMTDDNGNTSPQLRPVVYSSKLDQSNPIERVTMSTRFSSIRSRRR